MDKTMPTMAQMDEAEWVPLCKYKEVVAHNGLLLTQLKQSSELLNTYGDRLDKAEAELRTLHDFRKSIINNIKALLEDMNA